ncbi:hypothetical protein ACFODL_10880 [Phenylobacterium terrae]|uniref:ABM domain-containing protein n=1 Tax=Phenylobacterium terrae TaxID=2665495 RepID=A0ABW4MZJ5_9CAUL
MSFNEHTVICTYRVKAGARDAFLDLLRRHWPTLRDAGLATDQPALVFESAPGPDPHDEKGVTFVEIFSWAGAESARLAHETPAVMSVWEPMGGLTESREGRPPMEFPHFRPFDPHAA